MSTRKHTRKSAAKKSNKAPGSGRPSKFSGKKISKLVKENPRREGSIGHKSFALIQNGMTYEQYIAKGGRRQDLAFDLAKKNVKLSA